MPIYEYICLDCENSFETLVLSTDEEVVCPVCESKRLEKAMSSFASTRGLSDGLSSVGCSSKSGFS